MIHNQVKILPSIPSKIIAVYYLINQIVKKTCKFTDPVQLSLLQLQRLPQGVLPLLRRLHQSPVRTSPGSGFHFLRAWGLQFGYSPKRVEG